MDTDNNDEKGADWWKPGMVIFAKISGYIAIPIVVALYAGKYLDEKYHTAPYLFLTCITIAFFSTIFMIWREMKTFEKNNKK